MTYSVDTIKDRQKVLKELKVSRESALRNANSEEETKLSLVDLCRPTFQKLIALLNEVEDDAQRKVCCKFVGDDNAPVSKYTQDINQIKSIFEEEFPGFVVVIGLHNYITLYWDDYTSKQTVSKKVKAALDIVESFFLNSDPLELADAPLIDEQTFNQFYSKVRQFNDTEWENLFDANICQTNINFFNLVFNCCPNAGPLVKLNQSTKNISILNDLGNKHMAALNSGKFCPEKYYYGLMKAYNDKTSNEK